MHTIHFDGVSRNISVWLDEPDPVPSWTLEKKFIKFVLTRLHEQNEDMPEEEIRAKVKEALAGFHVDFAERRKAERTVPRIAGKTATGRAFALTKVVKSKGVRARRRFRWVPPGERKAA